MSTQKIVRCEVGRPGREPYGVRFIPLEIFGMWKYLMEHKHQFEVRTEEPSLWLELDPIAPIEAARGSVEPVTELQLFVVTPSQGILQEVRRYLPSTEVEVVRPVLLRHYASAAGDPPWRERPGVWFRPGEEQPEPATEARAGGS